MSSEISKRIFPIATQATISSSAMDLQTAKGDVLCYAFEE